MINFKKCSEVNLNDIVTAFNTGFSDYIIKLQMTEELLTNRFLKVEQNKLEYSFIAYDDQKPIGLMLGGIKDYEGLKTLRCGALCVNPEYRKLGIASKLYALHKQLAIENDCKRLYLEVIQGNDKAINFYLKQGYKVLSELVYYSHSNQEDLILSNVDIGNIQQIDLKEVELFHKCKVKTHLNWQNDFDYMRFFDLVNYKITEKDEIIGMISVHPFGKIFYLWIDKNYHNLGYDKILLSQVAKEFNMSKLSISFPNDNNLTFFLTNIGFTKDPISQYDMELILD